ncbi:hypothetical protein OAL43_00725 [bacterium]|nr:hypothetical protein [bacterium]
MPREPRDSITLPFNRRSLIATNSGRLLLYVACSALLLHTLLLLATKTSVGTLSAEHGPIEIAQVLILGLAGLALLIAARLSKSSQMVLIAASAMLFCAASREAEDWLATYLFDDAYKWFVCAPLILSVAVMAWRNRDSFLLQIERFAATPAGMMFSISILFLGVYCQALDRTAFWPALESNASLGDQKMFIEETAELFGYVLLFFSSIEFVIASWKERSQITKSDLGLCLLTAKNQTEMTENTSKADAA